MNSLAIPGTSMPITTGEALEKVLALEERIRDREQIEVQTEHILHGGMYSRTVRLAPGVVIVSVVIKVPTALIVNGKCRVFAGDRWHAMEGYNVMAGSAGRKPIFVTETATEITMIFPTQAQTVEQAEAEFTDEADGLLSRRQDGNDLITVTGA